MPYDLFITRKDGSTFRSLRSPYATRADMRNTVLVVATTGPGRSSKMTEAVRRFVDQVTEAPLGETVTHEPTGIAFRTEEV